MAFNFPLIGAMAPTASQLPPAQRDWRASLFDRLMPDGELSDKDKQAAMRQGLLGLASGLLGTGGGFGNALSAGIQGGLLATNKSVDDQATRQYRAMLAAQSAGGGTAFMALDAQARAAGYEPGTEGYKNFMKRDNGELARQSSAAIQYKTIKGADGREYTVALDPRDVGAQTIGGGATFGSFGPGVTQQQRVPGEVPFSIDPSLPPQVQAAIRANESQWANAPAGGQMQVPSAPQMQAQGNPFASRTPEEDAALKASAEERAKLGFLPMRGQIEAQNAGMATAAQEAARNAAEFGAYDAMTAKVAERAAAEARAKSGAEADVTAAKKSLDSMDTLGLLDVAEGLVTQSTGSGVGAVVDTAAGFFGKSSEGADAIASLQAIQGQLISKMPRMEGPQSDRDVDLYKDMAGRLADPWRPKPQRLAALQTIRELNQRYAKPAEPALDSLTDEDLLRQLGGM